MSQSPGPSRTIPPRAEQAQLECHWQHEQDVPQQPPMELQKEMLPSSLIQRSVNTPGQLTSLRTLCLGL